MAVNRIRIQKEDYDKYISEVIFVQNDVSKVMVNLFEYNTLINDTLIYKRHSEDFADKLEKLKNVYDGHIKVINEKIKDDKINKLYKEAITNSEEYFALCEKTLEKNNSIDKLKIVEAKNKVEKEIETSYDKTKAKWKGLLLEINKKNKKGYE